MLRRESDKNEALVNYPDITFGKLLGSGGFGEVYHGNWRHNDVAVKKLLLKNITPESAAEFETESQIMARLRSPNIVQFYGYAIEPERCIVMEYCPNGSLRDVLRSQQPLEWTVRIKIALGAAKGLAFLHEEKILHRDIKSLNVLLTEHFEAKLTDFGLSKLKTESKSESSAHNKSGKEAVGTIRWMAPELFGRGVIFTQKSDIYSLGITFWELASRQIPFSDALDNSLVKDWVKEGEREAIPQDCPSAFGALIQQCWKGDPRARPDTNAIIAQLKNSLEALSAPKISNAPTPNPSPAPKNEALVNYQDIVFGKILGSGGFAEVYHGTWRHNDVTIKKLLINEITAESAQEFEAESQIMARLRSPNIVQFYGYTIEPERCIVMEYCPNGSLFSVLHSDKPLEWSMRINIALGTTKGLAFLHEEKILHRDIKSLNILLTAHFEAKLTDFEFSKVETEIEYRFDTTSREDIRGTIAWMAPELFSRRGICTQKSDIYSLGVTFWELASRQIPFASAARPEVIPKRVLQGEREDIPTDCPPAFGTLIQQCWAAESSARPDTNAITTQLKNVLEGFFTPKTSKVPSPNPSPFPVSSGPQYLSNLVSEDVPKPLVFSPSQPKQPVHINTPRPQPAIQIKQTSPQAIAAFVRLVAEGEQDEAEALLQKDHTLALLPSDVTDLSGRTFKAITGFQYAVWALDWHMWTMIRKYLPNDDARAQLQAMASASWVKQHGQSASWQNLLDAQQKVIGLCDKSQWNAASTCLQREVGGAQRLLPVHVINEYCHPTRPFDPCPDFTKAELLPRTRKIDESEWFTATYNGGKLGEKFGIYRVGRMVLGAEGLWGTGGSRVAADHKSCHTLLITRTQQRDLLFAELNLGTHQRVVAKK